MTVQVNKKNIFFILYVVINTLFFTFLVGLRDTGTDTESYINFFYFVMNGDDTRIFEPSFVYLAKISSLFSSNHVIFFTLVSFFSLFTLFIFYLTILNDRLMVQRRLDIYYIFIIALVITLISPFFINTQVNVVRSGLSIPFIFLSAYYVFRRVYGKFIFYSFVAISFHFTAIIYIVSLLVFHKFRVNRLIIFFVIWCLFYISGLSQAFFTNFFSYLSFDILNYYLGYATRETSYKSGVRLDFLLFSVIFIAFISFLKNKNDSEIKNFLLFAYLSLLMPFLGLGFIAYSDRLLLPAWMLIPIIIAVLLTNLFKMEKNYFYLIFLSLPFFIGLALYFYKVI